jgi:hypothetical protein
VARQKAKRLLPKTIVCVSCGASKVTWKKSEQICRACDDKRRHGAKTCIADGCDKLINYKTTQLCSRHHHLRCAPIILKTYLDNYGSPHPQNERYMTELSSMVDWAEKSYCKRKISKETVRRFLGIGKLLQTYELPETLTWEAIDKALPPLTKKGHRTTTKLIRSSLMDLGHLHAKRGALPDWNTYLKQRRLQSASESTPATFRSDLLAFKAWAETGMLNPKLIISPARVEVLCNTPKAIAKTIHTVGHFLSWCVERNIRSLTAINETVVIDYQRGLLWQHECKVCGTRIPFQPEVPKTCLNRECRASRPYVLKERVTKIFVASETSHLRVFFDWAVLHDLLPQNPAKHELCRLESRSFREVNDGADSPRIGISIRRYAEDVVRKLCAYIVSPDADPEEALILYLIIFHLCTVAELCGLKVPSCVNREVNAEEDYKKLLFTPYELTRGNVSPRRTSLVLKFPPKASVSIVPLLKRYYEQRKGFINTDHYEYLLAANTRCRHNQPVSQMYVRRIVSRASLRVLKDGEVCASRLRITAAAMFAKKSRKRSGVLRPLGYRSARATEFNYLEEITLPLKTTIRRNDRRM